MTNPAPAQQLAPASNDVLVVGGVIPVVEILNNLDATYVPRAAMCRCCRKLSFVTECAKLPFHTMPVSVVYRNGDRAVRCSHYERERP